MQDARKFTTAESDPAKGKRLPRAERETQMLEVAARLFGQKGFEATSMDDIASECGVTKPMLYAYFKSKQGLYEALIARTGSYLLASLAELRGEKDPERRLRLAIDVLIRFVDKHHNSWRMIFSSEARAQHPGIALYRKQVLLAASLTLAEFRPSSLPEAEARKLVEPYAYVLLGAAESGSQWWMGSSTVTIEDVCNLAQRVLDGIIPVVKRELGAN